MEWSGSGSGDSRVEECQFLTICALSTGKEPFPDTLASALRSKQGPAANTGALILGNGFFRSDQFAIGVARGNHQWINYRVCLWS